MSQSYDPEMTETASLVEALANLQGISGPSCITERRVAGFGED
jgi:hypothetical protein